MLNELELNEVLNDAGIEMDAKELAFQLTAYENGYINYEKGLCDIIVNEKMEDLEESELISLYNNYLIENAYECYYEFDQDFFNEYFETPYEAARATQFGNVHWSDEYIKFNGYGNLESCSEYRLIKEAKQETGLIESILENEYSELLENDFKESIIKMVYDLVKAGY